MIIYGLFVMEFEYGNVNNLFPAFNAHECFDVVLLLLSYYFFLLSHKITFKSEEKCS